MYVNRKFDMSLFERTSRVIRANINSSKSAYEAVDDAQGNLSRMRKAVALAINARQQVQVQADKAKTAVDFWEQRAQLAIDKDREELARQALILKREHSLSLMRLEKQVEEQSVHLNRLQLQLASAEVIVTEIASASYSERSQKSADTLGTSSAMSAFERMEDKILQIEAAKLAEADLENQLAWLVQYDDVDYELEAMKAQMLNSAHEYHGALPQNEAQPDEVKNEAIDAELEALKFELDSL